MTPALIIVACGAPLAARVHDLAATAIRDGWDVTVVATRAALSWLDGEAVRRTVGRPAVTDYRIPDEPKRGDRPAAVVVCPATFNTVNRMALGIADSYPLGLLCEALGEGVPTFVVPMVNNRLWGHPAWGAHQAALADAGVTFLDLRTGDAGTEPVVSGTGPDVVAAFDPRWVTDRLREYL
jgi:phosphopantothenoylcysteine synthetase/decarboxylase